MNIRMHLLVVVVFQMPTKNTHQLTKCICVWALLSINCNKSFISFLLCQQFRMKYYKYVLITHFVYLLFINANQFNFIRFFRKFCLCILFNRLEKCWSVAKSIIFPFNQMCVVEYAICIADKFLNINHCCDKW